MPPCAGRSIVCQGIRQIWHDIHAYIPSAQRHQELYPEGAALAYGGFQINATLRGADPSDSPSAQSEVFCRRPSAGKRAVRHVDHEPPPIHPERSKCA